MCDALVITVTCANLGWYRVHRRVLRSVSVVDVSLRILGSHAHDANASKTISWLHMSVGVLWALGPPTGRAR